VTVTLFDVPPDVTGATTIDGAEAAITIAQPGQNGSVTFSGARDQRVVVHITKNAIGAVTINVVSSDHAVMTSITSPATFGMIDTALRTTSADPCGAPHHSCDVSVVPNHPTKHTEVRH